MKNVSAKKNRWKMFTRGLSCLLSLSIVLTFTLGFISFDWNNIKTVKADTLTSIYAASAAVSSTTSTTVYTVKLTGEGFVSGHTYFIYVTLGLTHSEPDGRVNYRIRYGTSTYLYTGDLEPAEASYNHSTQVDWMDVYTPSSSSSLYVEFKGITAGTTTSANAVLMAMDLSGEDMIENYDYYFGENTTPATHASSGYANKASITLNNADGVKDWLVFATEHVAVNSVAINHMARFNYASSYSMTRSLEGENALDDYSFAIFRTFDNIPRGTTITMQVGDDSTGSNTHTLSRIFAINLQVFRDRSTYYVDGADGLVEYPSWSTLRSTSYSASSTGTHIIFTSYMNDVAAANARSNNKLTVDGTIHPPDWDWTDGAGNAGKISYDATDITSNNIIAATNVSAGSRTIALLAQELGTATAQVADEVTMAVFSTEFNYRPQINNWRWYADEEDATPGTAYAAENTAPPQAEMGKSIGFKLRINLTEVGGLTENDNRKKLYYATSTTGPWTIVGETNGLLSLFRYYDGGGTDDAEVPTYFLTGSNAKGSHNESNTNLSDPSESDHATSTTTEFEYCIENYNAAANTLYYFALFDQTTGLIALPSGKSFPSLTTASSYDLSLETAPSAVYLGSWKIGDGAYHSYDFTSDEKLQLRDNRGQTAGASSGWSLSADITTELVYTAAAAYCSAVAFTGSGTDDMSVNRCVFIGHVDTDYKVEIDGNLFGLIDTFKWSDDGGATWDVEDVPIVAEGNELNNGITILFDTINEHTLGDYWEFTAYVAETYTIIKANMYWITNAITGLYDAPTTNINNTSGDGYMSSAVTAVTVSGNAKDGLGGFKFQPTLRIYNATTPGDYTGGVITFTLT